MIRKSIAIIGAGHIGHAILAGLLKAKKFKREDFILTNSKTKNNILAARSSQIIFIAVKPRIVGNVVSEIKNYVTEDKLIISVAACVPINLLEKYFYPKILKIVRIMPNIPVAYGKGVVGWIGNKQIDSNDKKLVKKLLGPLGVIVACKDEESLDKLSMISGCGPGYVGYFINNLEKVARRFGFSQKESKKIVEATFLGTLLHLKRTKNSSEDLVSSVATKGGITEEVIKSLESGGLYQILLKSIKRGYDKIGKIKKELENDDF